MRRTVLSVAGIALGGLLAFLAIAAALRRRRGGRVEEGNADPGRSRLRADAGGRAPAGAIPAAAGLLPHRPSRPARSSSTPTSASSIWSRATTAPCATASASAATASTWQGLLKISRKQEWPDWRPPPEMIQRQPYLPRFMAGGPGNPLGARALYLGDTVYRIHGTNQPQTIGHAVSSGCFRLVNPRRHRPLRPRSGRHQGRRAPGGQALNRAGQQSARRNDMRNRIPGDGIGRPRSLTARARSPASPRGLRGHARRRSRSAASSSAASTRASLGFCAAGRGRQMGRASTSTSAARSPRRSSAMPRRSSMCRSRRSDRFDVAQGGQDRRPVAQLDLDDVARDRPRADLRRRHLL